MNYRTLSFLLGVAVTFMVAFTVREPDGKIRKFDSEKDAVGYYAGMCLQMCEKQGLNYEYYTGKSKKEIRFNCWCYDPNKKKKDEAPVVPAPDLDKKEHKI